FQSNGDKPHQSLPSLIQKAKYTAALSWRHDRNSHFFTPLVIIFNAKHFLTENVVTVALPLSK
ncbi:hypothetical protein ACEWFA_26130, partial [Klebsiella pneumoniae]|uniref:hypothetical protein n=1 Tax=Klebsiella pneumoniae TaxID=573 RepID=UPI0035B9AE51